MVLSQKATTGIATQAEGTFTNCGSGSNDFELTYHCQGPACSSLDGSLLDITCHRDGNSRLVCSNGSKCQPETSSYRSNFTFSQNEPDPWSPVMENEPDVWVPQTQHVMVANCARFSLTSDGTKQGTRVDDKGPKVACPNVEGVSIASSPAGQPRISTPIRRPPTVATQRPLIFAGTGSRHTLSTASLLLALVSIWFLILPEAYASAVHRHDEVSLGIHGFRARATSKDVKAFAEGFRTNLAQRAGDQGFNGEAFANDLVANVVTSVCGSHFDGFQPGLFTPEVVRICVSSIYDTQSLPQPGLSFLAVLGASLLCDYIVSETYPNGQDFLQEGCEGLQELINEARTSGPVLVQPLSSTSSMLSTQIEAPKTQLVLTPSSNVQDLYHSAFTSSLPKLSSLKDASTVEMSRLGTSPSGIPSSAPQPPDTKMLSSPLNNIVYSLASSSTTVIDSASPLAIYEVPSGASTPTDSRIPGISSLSPSPSDTIGTTPPDSIASPAALSATPSQPLQTDLGPPKSSATPAEASSTSLLVTGEEFSMASPSMYIEPTTPRNDDAEIATVALDTAPTLDASVSRLRTLDLPDIAFLSSAELEELSSATIDSLLHALPPIGSASSATPVRAPASISNTRPSPDHATNATTEIQISSRENPGSRPISGKGRTRSAETWFTEPNKPSSSDPSSFMSADPFEILPEIDNLSPTHIQLMSASVEVLTIISTLIETIISTGSTAKSWVPSSLILSGPGIGDLRTMSWYGNLSTSSSELRLLSATPQPSNISTPYVDRGHKTSLLNLSVSAHVTNDLMSVPASFNPVEMSSAASTSLPYLSVTAAISVTQYRPALPVGSTATLRSSSRATATQLAALPTDRWASSIRSESSDSAPNLVSLMTTDTASSASALVSMFPGIEPIKNQQLTEESLLPAIPATTTHLASTFSSTTFAISNDQALASSCSRNFKQPNYCPSSGCVSLMSDKAHCGGCNQICGHVCHQGICMCPDFARPDEDGECVNNPNVGACVTGYARNIFKVCAPARTTTLLGSSVVPPFALAAPKEPPPVSATAFPTQVPNLGSMFCPPGLPNICNGGCFNTKTEHNHCGGCGKFCSATCINGQCLAKPTPSRLQLVSSRRTVTITRVLTQSPVSPTSPPVASYIWKGLAGV